MTIRESTVTTVEGGTPPSTPPPSRGGHERVFDVWIPLAVMATFPFVLLLKGPLQISDPDSFWHIRAGHYVLETWRLSGPEPWSAASSHPWVLHEWLTEVLMGAADSANGLAGVTTLWALGMVSVFVALFMASRHQGTILQALIGAMAGWFGASAGFGPRPQLVTFALLAVTTGAWLRSSRDLKPRWWLVPMTWLWACAHGMWFIGPIVGLAVTGGLLLDGRDRRAVLRLAIVPVLSVLVAAVTPVGPQLLLAPFAVSDYTKYVTEWAPAGLTSPTFAATLAMLLLTLMMWLRRGERVPWSHVALWFVALGWMLLYARTIAVGAVIAAPLLVGALHATFGGPPPVRLSARRGETMLLLGSVAVALVAVATMSAGTSSRPDHVPSGLNSQLDALAPRTVVFNEYSLGGWLLWRHPDLLPVIDGRTEIFSVAYVDDYMVALSAQPGWQATLDRSGARVALVPDASALGDALVHSRGWKVTGADDGYLLLQAP